MEQTIKQTSNVVKIMKWNAVAIWVYDSVSDTCNICKNPLRESCITCQANQEKFDQNNCKKTVGKCNHCFHQHCIEEWGKKQNNCPLDMTEWIPMKFVD